MLMTILAKMSSDMTDSGDTVGGGDVLQYMDGSEDKDKFSLMDTNKMHEFFMLPYVRVALIAIVTLIIVLLILKITSTRFSMRRKGAATELKSLKKLRKNENKIYRINKMLYKITNIVEHSAFKIPEAQKKRLEYRLRRANIVKPGGNEIISPESFNALVVVGKVILTILGMLILLVISTPVGIAVIILVNTVTNLIVDTAVTIKVDEKDNEIKENFPSMYFMIHHTLIRNASTPISSILKTYDKTTESEEMHKLVDTCIHYMSIYGEYSATSYIAEEYKEIQYIVKLMRIIRQAGQGGEIKAELLGFRESILTEEKYRMRRESEKKLRVLNITNVLVYVVLVQAIISAMAIYISDFGGITAFM